MVPGLDMFLTGGAGGLGISPSATSTSGLNNSSLNFGNSASSLSAGYFVAGGIGFVAGLLITKLAK